MKNNPVFLVVCLLVFITSCDKNPPEPLTVTDIDGNVYHTVKIYQQVWMVENLRTTRYNNGDPIETTSPVTRDIGLEDGPKYQWAHGGVEAHVEKYGRLYTWYAVTDDRNVCPDGWRVPWDADWIDLVYNITGPKPIQDLKELGTVAGYRSVNGIFASVGQDRGWWTFSEVMDTEFGWSQFIGGDHQNVKRSKDEKSAGLSVRCVQGDPVPCPPELNEPKFVIDSAKRADPMVDIWLHCKYDSILTINFQYIEFWPWDPNIEYGGNFDSFSSIVVYSPETTDFRNLDHDVINCSGRKKWIQATWVEPGGMETRFEYLIKLVTLYVGSDGQEKTDVQWGSF
jgi:hypothetical protein